MKQQIENILSKLASGQITTEELTAALTELKDLATEPDPALLASMAVCMNHGFGLLRDADKEAMMYNMRKLWDETMGVGFYRPARRQFYLNMIDLSVQSVPQHSLWSLSSDEE